MKKIISGIMFALTFCFMTVVKADESVTSNNLISPSVGSSSVNTEGIIIVLGIIGLAIIIGVIVYMTIMKLSSKKKEKQLYITDRKITIN